MRRIARDHGTGESEWNNIASPEGVGNGCCRLSGGVVPTPIDVIITISKAKCKKGCIEELCGTCYAVETKERTDGRWDCERYGLPDVPTEVDKTSGLCGTKHQCHVYSNDGLVSQSPAAACWRLLTPPPPPIARPGPQDV